MNLYVGNLSPETTEGDLRTLFSEFGEIVSVKILLDAATGLPRGFGFVEMADKYHGYDAITNLDMTYVQGNIINVRESKPKGTDNRSGGGGFNRGGNRSGGGGNFNRNRTNSSGGSYNRERNYNDRGTGGYNRERNYNNDNASGGYNRERNYNSDSNNTNTHTGGGTNFNNDRSFYQNDEDLNFNKL